MKNEPENNDYLAIFFCPACKKEEIVKTIIRLESGTRCIECRNPVIPYFTGDVEFRDGTTY